MAGLWSSLADALGAPLLGPDIMSFGSLPPLSLWHNGAFPLVAAAPLHSGLPAPKGTEFDGPDPGLNAAIISEWRRWTERDGWGKGKNEGIR